MSFEDTDNEKQMIETWTWQRVLEFCFIRSRVRVERSFLSLNRSQSVMGECKMDYHLPSTLYTTKAHILLYKSLLLISSQLKMKFSKGLRTLDSLWILTSWKKKSMDGIIWETQRSFWKHRLRVKTTEMRTGLHDRQKHGFNRSFLTLPRFHHSLVYSLKSQ